MSSSYNVPKLRHRPTSLITKKLLLKVTKSFKHNTVHSLCTRVSDEHINFIFLKCSEAKVWAPYSEY